MAEDQERQLLELHRSRPLDRSQDKKPAGKNNVDGPGSQKEPPKGEDAERKSAAPGRGLCCFKCNGRGHKYVDCPLHNKTHRETPGQDSARSLAVHATQTGTQETLEDRSLRLQEELAEVEYQRMAQAYAGVDTVTGAVGPLYYSKVEIEGTEVEAMIDTGPSYHLICSPRSDALPQSPVRSCYALT